MITEILGTAATIAAIAGLGFLGDRRIASRFRKIGVHLDLIDARLTALTARSNGSDPHVGSDTRTLRSGEVFERH